MFECPCVCRVALPAVLLAAMLCLVPGCRGRSAGDSRAGAPRQDRLTVFAAASLTESFDELARQFESANPGVKVTCHYAGSQQLLAQLSNGAPADVFASANPKEMDGAVNNGLVRPDAVRIFARNRMVIVRSNKSGARIESLADLAQAGVKVAIADPSVPIGRYTSAMLTNAESVAGYGPGFAARVMLRVISCDANVKAVLAKVRLGEADAGVVYATDVTPQAARDVAIIEPPVLFNVIATYPIAPLTDAAAPGLAGRFVDFVASPQGRKILDSFGFMPPPATQPEQP